MSDYISKSALLEQLIGIDDEIVKGCIGVIQTQPTVDEKEIIRKAFERIVERLEEAGDKYFNMGDIYSFSSMNEAIVICKEEGGIE